MKKAIIYSSIALALVGAVLFTNDKAFAQSSDGTTLVSLLAQKFGTSESEVQSVFDQFRAAHHEEMQNRFEERLNTAVSDGKITEEQKQKILAKHSEMFNARQGNIEEWKDMTPDERREAMRTKHDELKVWADANGIDLEYFGFGFGKGPMGGRHGFMMKVN